MGNNQKFVFPQPNSQVKRLKDVLPQVDFHSRGQFDRLIKHPESLPYTITKSPSMFFYRRWYPEKTDHRRIENPILVPNRI